MNNKAGVLILLLSATANLLADVKLPALLSDNMVLQQQSDARFWGWAGPGEKITVHASWDKEASAPVTADKDGKWKMALKTPKATGAGGPYTITVKGNNTIELKNILIGEVWVCSGQSNMEFRLPHATNGKEEVTEANYPQIRFFNVRSAATAHPAEDVKGQWSECTPKTAGGILAVPYFFAKKIHKELNIPIGLVCPVMGATPARAWTSGKMLLEKNMYVNEVKMISDKETIDKAKAKYDAEMDCSGGKGKS